MSVTYYVALPFVRTEDGSAAGQAQECQSVSEANPFEGNSWGNVIHEERGMADPAKYSITTFQRKPGLWRAS